MTRTGFAGKSCARASPASHGRIAAIDAASALRAALLVAVMLMGVGGLEGAVAVIVVVHHLRRHVGKHLARARRRAARPFDAALLARRLEKVLPREPRRKSGRAHV